MTQNPRVHGRWLVSLLLFTLVSSIAHAEAKNPWVDLHVHLFMKEGIPQAFLGDFNGPILATSWKDGFSSQANPQTLNDSGLGVVVVSLYAATPLVDQRRAIRKQIQLARQFVAQNKDWVLAKHPAQAIAAYQHGKRVMILSLESAASILETPEDLDEFIQRDGIRIVTFAHLMDDEYGGTAILHGVKALANPLALPDYTGNERFRCEGTPINSEGLTEAGRKMVAELIRRKVWIDLAHSPDLTQRELIPMLEKAGQPLLVTHTSLRKYYHGERGIAQWQLQKVKESHGIIGVVPSHDMLSGTVFKPGEPCQDDVHALAIQYNEVASQLDPGHTLLGTDLNGAVDHLKPNPKCPTHTSLDAHGFYQIGQTPEVWGAMKNAGAHWDTGDEETPALKFLKTWQKLADPQAGG